MRAPVHSPVGTSQSRDPVMVVRQWIIYLRRQLSDKQLETMTGGVFWVIDNLILPCGET